MKKIESVNFLKKILQKTYPVIPTSGTGQLRIFNTLNCPLDLTLDKDTFNVKGLEMLEKTYDFSNGQALILNYTSSYKCLNISPKPREFSHYHPVYEWWFLIKKKDETQYKIESTNNNFNKISWNIFCKCRLCMMKNCKFWAYIY